VRDDFIRPLGRKPGRDLTRERLSVQRLGQMRVDVQSE
jgi:hypothetical protein